MGILISILFGWTVGFLATLGLVGSFNVINMLFADREIVSVDGVVTNRKYYHMARGRYDISRYITIVSIPGEQREISIDDIDLFKLNENEPVTISYRNGLLA